MKQLKEWAPLIGLAIPLLGGMAWLDGRQAARMDRIEGRLGSIEAEVVSQGKSIAHIEGRLTGVQLVLVPEGGPDEGRRYRVHEVQALTVAEDDQ